MKKLIVLVYILVVATLSINAKANEDVSLQLTNINYDSELQVIHIEGQYPNPCVVDALPTLKLENDKQLTLDVVGNSTAEICIQVLGPKFMLAADLSEFKAQLGRMGLDENATHKIYDRSGKLIAEVDFSTVFFRIEFEPTTISGVLKEEGSGLFLLDPTGKKYEVESPLPYIHLLSDREVTLTGHKNMHSVSLPAFKSNKSVLQFIATGVSYSALD